MNREALVDFGPLVHEGPVRRRNTTRQNFTLRDSKRRNIEASLIAHLNSHTDAVNGIAISPDHLFFVSCSDDKTVRVWDSARLERNVTSKPRHTYGQHHSKVKCICILEGHHAFASAAEDGSLHVVRIDVNQSGSLPKYNRLHVVREYRVERPGEYIQCLTHYNSGKPHVCPFITTCLIVYHISRLFIKFNIRNESLINCRPRFEYHAYISYDGELSSLWSYSVDLPRSEADLARGSYIIWCLVPLGSTIRVITKDMECRGFIN